jgi:predicted transglutaminase-like cysteine proteinase
MIRALTLSTLLMATGAQARELTPSDMQRAEHINQSRNAWAYGQRFTASDPVCGVLAVNKANDLLRAGYGAEEVRIAIVTVENGQSHAVAELIGTVRGKPQTVVLDSRFSWTLERQDAEARGYVWTVEFQGMEAR